MRVIVQRVESAKCIVDGKVTGEIGKGYMLLVGFTHHDTEDNIKKMVKKIINLRIFDDEDGKMNLNIKSVGGEILSISQFTLYGNCDNGNRPYFIEALPSNQALPLYLKFNSLLKSEGNLKVEEGIFGAHMYLYPVCDGPVTITLEM